MKRGIQIFLIMTLFGSIHTGVIAQETGAIIGEVSVTGYKNAADAVIYLDPGDNTSFKPSDAVVTMDQEGFTFVPHVLPIQVGTTVEFFNSDAELHNVFTPDKIAEKFNLGSWPKGEKRSYTFKKPGSVVLLCNVHPEMEGWVYVSPSPYFTATGADGNFAIKGVPPGEYTLKIWHEKLEGAPQAVTVSAGDTSSVQFALSR